jgi:hypothetical protein
MLISTILIFGAILAGFVHIVHPPTARRIATWTAKVVLGTFAAEAILSYLWADRIGRLLLISAAILALTMLVRRRT